jgi:hypothetical protein
MIRVNPKFAFSRMKVTSFFAAIILRSSARGETELEIRCHRINYSMICYSRSGRIVTRSRIINDATRVIHHWFASEWITVHDICIRLRKYLRAADATYALWFPIVEERARRKRVCSLDRIATISASLASHQLAPQTSPFTSRTIPAVLSKHVRITTRYGWPCGR